MDGQFVTNSLAVKLLQMKTVFTGNESAAVIMLSTSIDSSEDDARTRLKSLLMSLTELQPHLAGAGKQNAAPKSLN
jgi:hypothetical protein